MCRGKTEIGRAGERFALEFIKRKGYAILETNYRTPFGEIDIVAGEKGRIVFIEVKTRVSSSLGPPYLSVTSQKKRHLIKNGLAYLKRFGKIDTCWRINVVSVKLNESLQLENIELIENAVEEEY